MSKVTLERVKQMVSKLSPEDRQTLTQYLTDFPDRVSTPMICAKNLQYSINMEKELLGRTIILTITSSI